MQGLFGNPWIKPGLRKNVQTAALQVCTFTTDVQSKLGSLDFNNPFPILAATSEAPHDTFNTLSREFW